MTKELPNPYHILLIVLICTAIAVFASQNFFTRQSETTLVECRRTPDDGLICVIQTVVVDDIPTSRTLP